MLIFKFIIHVIKSIFLKVPRYKALKRDSTIITKPFYVEPEPPKVHMPIDTTVNYWYIGMEIVYGHSAWTVAKTPLDWDESMVRSQILLIDNDVSHITKCEPLNEPAGHDSYQNIYYNFVTKSDERNTIIDSILN